MPQGIDYFGRGHWLSDVQARVSVRARRQDVRGLAIARPAISPGRASSTWARLPTGNASTATACCHGSRRRACACRSTLPRTSRTCGLAPGRADSRARAGAADPGPDASHDWVSSSAVIEHVGSAEQQEAFLRECARVARRGLFVTCPNRWHWLEFHTKLPLLHWLPREWHRAVLRGSASARGRARATCASWAARELVGIARASARCRVARRGPLDLDARDAEQPRAGRDAQAVSGGRSRTDSTTRPFSPSPCSPRRSRRG